MISNCIFVFFFRISSTVDYTPCQQLQISPCNGFMQVLFISLFLVMFFQSSDEQFLGTLIVQELSFTLPLSSKLRPSAFSDMAQIFISVLHFVFLSFLDTISLYLSLVLCFCNKLTYLNKPCNIPLQTHGCAKSAMSSALIVPILNHHSSFQHSVGQEQDKLNITQLLYVIYMHLIE